MYIYGEMDLWLKACIYTFMCIFTYIYICTYIAKWISGSRHAVGGMVHKSAALQPSSLHSGASVIRYV